MKESRKGKTPNGGVRSEIYFTNEKREAVSKEQATVVEIVEFDENDKEVGRTYMKKGE